MAMIEVQADREPVPLVLLTTQRSGSTYLRCWLNSHPQVRCHSEVFLRNYPAADGFRRYWQAGPGGRLLYGAAAGPGAAWLPLNPALDWMVGRYLEALYRDPAFSAPWSDMQTRAWMDYRPRPAGAAERVVGYQLMYNQFTALGCLRRRIARQGARVVHLVRENSLKLLLSLETSARTRVYQTRPYLGTETPPPPRLRLDPRWVVRRLDAIEQRRERMRRCLPENPWLEVGYERFFADYGREAARVCAFLEIPEEGFKHPDFLRKLNPDALEDLVENYEELARALEQAGYARFLVGGPGPVGAAPPRSLSENLNAPPRAL